MSAFQNYKNSTFGQLRLHLADERATQELAQRTALGLSLPALFTFIGEIGTGKTTFIRALLRSLGVREAIKSPTYSLVESYETPKGLIHHFDLYRIADDAELEYTGFRDYFNEPALCCIEWPQRISKGIIKTDVEFTITTNGDSRMIDIKAISAQGDLIVNRLSSEL